MARVTGKCLKWQFELTIWGKQRRLAERRSRRRREDVAPLPTSTGVVQCKTAEWEDWRRGEGWCRL